MRSFALFVNHQTKSAFSHILFSSFLDHLVFALLGQESLYMGSWISAIHGNPIFFFSIQAVCDEARAPRTVDQFEVLALEQFHALEVCGKCPRPMTVESNEYFLQEIWK